MTGDEQRAHTEDGDHQRTIAALRGAHALLLGEAQQGVTDVSPAKDDPESPRQRVGRRWLGAAVACAVVAAGVGVAMERHQGSSVVSATPSASDSAGGPDTALAPSPPLSQTSGWKWESVLGISLQVPQAWGWGNNYASACDAHGVHPFVGMPFTMSNLVLCQGPALDAHHAPFVEVLPLTENLAVAKLRRVVGQRQIVASWGSALDQAATRATAQRVLDSAREFDIDVSGCPATMPAPTGSMATLRTVERAAVCQYVVDRTGVWLPAASRAVTGAQAARLADAVASAPMGSGPEPVPGSCSTNENIAFVLRFQTASGVQNIALHYNRCTGNGVVAGDGTFHQLTSANCAGAMGDPVRIAEASTPVDRVCFGH